MLAAIDEAWQAARARGPRAQVRFIGRLVADYAHALVDAWWPRRQGPHTPGRGRDPRWRSLLRDLRLAARTMRRGRLSTAAIVLTLAFAIGANAAVFSVVNAVLLRPLPYVEPDRLVMVWENNVARFHDRNAVGTANFLEWQDRAHAFAGLAAFTRDVATVTGGGGPEELPAYLVSWNFFDLLGVRPVLGRTFRPDEAAPSGPRAVVLGWSVWQRRYHGDTSVLGRSVILDGLPRTVVGIMPADFAFLGNRADFWEPFRFTQQSRTPVGRSLQVIGRLARGVSTDQARAEMETIAVALERQWPLFDAGWRVSVIPAQEDLTGPVRLPLLFLLAAVGVVLLVGCANTANLLLARASERRREMAVRVALGASRVQLMRQLLLEGLVLATAGGLGGLALAQLALAGLLHVLSRTLGIPRIEDAQLNGPVLAFALGLMGLCALAFSSVPALHISVGNVMPALHGGGRWSTTGWRDRRVRQSLVVVQVALAVVLVVAGGLVTRSLGRLTAVDPGFDPSHVLTFTVSLPSTKYPTPPASTEFFGRAVAELRTLPGVEHASGIAFLPFGGMGAATPFTVIGRPLPPHGQEPVADIRPIDEDYFNVMRIPLKRGRFFTRDEVAHGPYVAIISDTTARVWFPDQNPIGQRLKVEWHGGPDEIVGVVGDVKHDSLKAAARPMIYYPYGRAPIGFMTFVVRSAGDETSLVRGARATMRQLDPDLPVTDVRTMRELVGDSVASPALAAMRIAAFAGIALLLALIGIGALLAASVAARTTEFGIRLALGARPDMVRRLVLAQAAWLVLVGVALGLGVAAALSRTAGSVLYDVRPTDPAVYLITAGLVAGLALVAADVPARRATHVDPAETLRG
jgi:putative ABC transport system permease protein